MKLKDCLIETEVDREYKGKTREEDNTGKPTKDEDEVEESVSPSELRIVEGRLARSLTTLDDDCEILGVPLKLDEACSIAFDKHVAAIEEDLHRAVDRRAEMAQLNEAQKNRQEYDRRYKEMPRDRIRWRKAK